MFKKILQMVAFVFLFFNLHAQKLLSSTYDQIRAQMEIEPDVQNKSFDYNFNGGTSYIYILFKNGDKYKFSFTPNTGKLYGMTLSCSSNEKTRNRFYEEITKRSAEKRSAESYIYYDERGRGIFLWLTSTDLGNSVISWEAKFPFAFD